MACSLLCRPFFAPLLLLLIFWKPQNSGINLWCSVLFAISQKTTTPLTFSRNRSIHLYKKKFIFLNLPCKSDHVMLSSLKLEVNKIDPTAWTIKSYFLLYIPESLLACSTKANYLAKCDAFLGTVVSQINAMLSRLLSQCGDIEMGQWDGDNCCALLCLQQGDSISWKSLCRHLESQGRPVLNVMVQMEPTLPPTTIGLRVFRQEK